MLCDSNLSVPTEYKFPAFEMMFVSCFAFSYKAKLSVALLKDVLGQVITVLSSTLMKSVLL